MCIIWNALDARLGLPVSLEHAFTCVSTINQAERRSSATHLLARWEHERTTAWWSRAQRGGPSVIPTAGKHYIIRKCSRQLTFSRIRNVHVRNCVGGIDCQPCEKCSTVDFIAEPFTSGSSSASGPRPVLSPHRQFLDQPCIGVTTWLINTLLSHLRTLNWHILSLR